MRSLTRKEPDTALTPLLREMERMFSDWRLPRALEETTAPPIELSETDDEVVVKAQVPGMKKEDLHIEILDGQLNLRGEVKESQEEKKKNFYRSEFRYGGFSRTVPLPSGVDTAKATAKMDSGVLELRVPKTEEARKHTRKIEIR